MAEVAAPVSSVLVVGDFTIRPYGAGDYWIERAGGEGMQVFAINFERLIRDYFESEF